MRRGLRRGTRCGDRVAIRQRRLRSGTGVGRRPGPAQSRCDRRGGYGCSPGGQARHVHHSHRHGRRRRSSRIWPGRKPCASWRKRHRALAHGRPSSAPSGCSCSRRRSPELSRVAVLWNPDTPYEPKVIEELKAAAPSLSIELNFVSARTPEEIRSSILGFQPSARPGAVRDRRCPLLCSSNDASQAGVEGPATSHLLRRRHSPTKAG